MLCQQMTSKVSNEAHAWDGDPSQRSYGAVPWDAASYPMWLAGPYDWMGPPNEYMHLQ